jgi:hypothetical protein
MCTVLYSTAKKTFVLGSSFLYPVEVSLPDLTKILRLADLLLKNPRLSQPPLSDFLVSRNILMENIDKIKLIISKGMQN